MIKIALALFAGVLAHGAQAAGTSVYDVDRGTGQVSFVAVGKPGFLKIHGKGGAPRGTLNIAGAAVHGTLTFDLTSLDTGMSLRNEHMKNKYLEVGKFPTASLAISDVAVPAAFVSSPIGTIADKIPFHAMLTLHGATHPVDGTAHLENKGDSIAATADFSVKPSDYGIATPSYAGITIGDEADVTVDVTAPLKAGP